MAGAAVLLLGLAACATQVPATASPSGQTSLRIVTREQIAELLAAPDRTEADRRNDQRRKPQALLEFIEPRRGMVALDVASGGGYTTELLARALGPSGKVYGQGRPSTAARTPATALAERSRHLADAHVAAAPMIAVAQPFEDPVPAEVADGRLDLVTLMFNYHDMGHLGVDRARMNAAIFRALRHGGTFVVADHAGRPGTGISESGTLHRIEESFLRSEVEAAGFRLEAEGTFLRNPADPRDRAEPEPPMPKDEFVLKFVKP